MKLHILAVGHKMPDWIATGFDEYAKRMPPELRIELREIKPEQRSSGRPAESVMAAERQKIEAALPKNARIVALDERGKDWTTMQLSGALPGGAAGADRPALSARYVPVGWTRPKLVYDAVLLLAIPVAAIAGLVGAVIGGWIITLFGVDAVGDGGVGVVAAQLGGHLLQGGADLALDVGGGLAGRGEVHPPGQALAPGGAAAGVAGLAGEDGGQGGGARVQEVGVLEDHADAASGLAQLTGGQGGHVLAVDTHLLVAHRQHAGQQGVGVDGRPGTVLVGRTSPTGPASIESHVDEALDGIGVRREGR